MRKLLGILLVLALASSLAQAQQSQVDSGDSVSKPTKAATMTYAQALSKAKAGDKPLLILVTAEWCPPCRQMKAATLPTLMQRKSFQNFHFTMMDYDKSPKIADQLIGNRGLPQMIMFEKSGGKWLRRYITGNDGIHSVQRVESFVAQAGTYRLAATSEDNISKK